jgi:REP element-mobilizing transposase RayT
LTLICPGPHGDFNILIERRQETPFNGVIPLSAQLAHSIGNDGDALSPAIALAPKEFLLKFARDRKRWLQWLFEAKKRFGLDILNYAVTSDHIHLLVADGEEEVIPKSLQLVAEKRLSQVRAKGRKVREGDDRYELREPQAAYNAHFTPENGLLS